MFTPDTDLTKNQIFVSRDLSPTIANRAKENAERRFKRQFFINYKTRSVILEHKSQQRVVNSFEQSLASKNRFMHMCLCIHKLIKLPLFGKFTRYMEEIMMLELNCQRCGADLDALTKSRIDTNLCVSCNKLMHKPKQRIYTALGRIE
jgi:transcription initiation factor IIE alpha subunit